MEELSGVGIPRDLMVDILSRLPAKTLCKFRCVSRAWLMTRSPYDPYFIRLHRHRSKKNPFLLFQTISMDEEERFTLRLSSVDTNGTLRDQFTESIAGSVYASMSCTELICLVTHMLYSYVYVCNPSTKEFLKLPYSSKFQVTYGVGVGHLPSLNQYKIVQLFEKRTDPNGSVSEVGCQVFTITDGWPNSEGAWRVIGDCPFLGAGLKPHVFINGAIYWMIKGKRYYPNTQILSFDLVNEAFGVVLFPKCYSRVDPDSARLMAMDGSLCVVDSMIGLRTVDIWVLKDQENHIWVKEYSFDFSDLDYGVEIVDYIPSGHGRELLLLIKPRKESLVLVYYNIETKSFRRTENLDIETGNSPDVYFNGFFSLGSR